MRFENTNRKYCNECGGSYKIRALFIGGSEVALCSDCRTRLYEIVDEEDTLVVYQREV